MAIEETGARITCKDQANVKETMPSTVVNRANLISTAAHAGLCQQHIQLQVYFRAVAKTGVSR